MFIEIEELKTVAYSYQVNEIAEADDDVITAAIATAISEMQGYLRPNNKSEYGDGRLVYDVDAVFNATGMSRDALILQYTKIAALWHLLILCNVDIIYDHIKERYDRVVEYMGKVNKGEVTLSLPTKEPDEGTSKLPFRFGSRAKFNHE